MPLITLCSPPITRLRAIEAAEGWTKLTVSLEVMLKRSQSIRALGDVWVTVSVFPEDEKLTVPLTTWLTTWSALLTVTVPEAPVRV